MNRVYKVLNRKSVLLLLPALLCLLSGSWVTWAFASDQEKATPGYGYNYPHKVPQDYVYRTGRIFAPQQERKNWFEGWQNFFKRKRVPGPPPAVPAEQAGELKLQVRELTRQLLAHSDEPIGDAYRVVVTTFVNLNRLYKTSGLGRVMTEQMISELQRAGVEVVDMRMTPSVQISEGFGEYGLSRDMSQLSYVQDAQAVVVGTYTVSDGQVMVNARLLQQGDGLVLSSATIVFEGNELVFGFLQDEAMPPKSGTLVELRGFSEIAPQEVGVGEGK